MSDENRRFGWKVGCEWFDDDRIFNFYNIDMQRNF